MEAATYVEKNCKKIFFKSYFSAKISAFVFYTCPWEGFLVERVLVKTKAPVKGKNAFITRKELAISMIGIMGFFLGRVVVFDTLNPIAVSFLATLLGRGSLVLFFVTALLIGLGFFTTELYLLKYGICLVLLLCTQLFVHKRRIRLNEISQSVMGGMAIFTAGLIFALLSDLSFYYGLIAVIEGLLAFALTFVLQKASRTITGARRGKFLDAEELISIAILMGSVVAGAAAIYIGAVSLRIVLCVMVLLVVAYKGGGAMAAMTGLMLGLLLIFSGYTHLWRPLIFGLGACIGGMLKERGKLSVIVGFLAGGAAIILYADISLVSVELFFSVAVASVLFYFMPDNFYFNLNSSINPTIDNTEEYIQRVKEISTLRLNAFARAFERLSKTFSGLSEKKTSLSQRDIARLIDDIAAKACVSCGLKEFCWQNNFYDTYQTIFTILGTCEKKGRIEQSDIPSRFRENCVNAVKFTDVCNRLFEHYKINLAWHNRIVESRELVSQQLSGVAGIIARLSEELDLYIQFKEDLEESIRLELSRNNVEVEQVIVLENRVGKYEITLTHKPCYGKKSCTKDIIGIISKVMGRKMKNSETNCQVAKGNCRLRLLEEQKYRVSSGVAKATKTGSQESGDTYSFMELKNGQCLLALSDGMGSGARAQVESEAVIDLLENFIESGFEKELAIKMINSVLVLKSSQESFSTLDICSVDLYTGHADFMKIGAATTFLLRDGAVQIIKSSTLPIGILSTVDLEVSSRQLKANDMVIMVTDGLLDTNTEHSANAWIIEALSRYSGQNPQDIADYILEEGVTKNGGDILDDMTVLAARFWERP